MPPLRPSHLAAGKGYVCSSCTTKLQYPRLFPAFTRSLSSTSFRKAAKKNGKPTVLPRLNSEAAEKVEFKYYEQDEAGQRQPVDTEREERVAERLDVAQKAIEKELKRMGTTEGFKGDAEGSFEEKLQLFDEISKDLEGEPVKEFEEEEEEDVDFDEKNVLGGLSADEHKLFEKMMAAFERRAKAAESDRVLDGEDEVDILEGLNEEERKIFHTMRQSMEEVTSNELFNDEERAELSSGKLKIPLPTKPTIDDELKQLQENVPAEELAQIPEPQEQEPSAKPQSTRKRRNIKPKPELLEPTHTLSESDVIIPRSGLPREGQAYISRLNEALEKAMDHTGKHRKELWRWYSLSRKTLATRHGQVPAATWDLLWEEFSVESLDNPDRMAHIRTLAADMEAANVPLKAEQNLLYIEALFIDNHQQQALLRWESARPSLTLVPSTSASYWALGVRMLAGAKQPAKSQEAADMLLSNLNASSEARALIPLIRAWTEFNDKAAVQISWAIYVRFKFWMGDKMEMDDYDKVAAIFLDAGHADLALAVFRDMMLTGDPQQKQYDSLTLHQRLTGIKIQNLKSFQLAPKETEWRSSEHLSLLPAKFRNKYFFGSWIKKLVGENEIDYAAAVIELMSTKSIRPSATFLNGIIGAWFRSGTKENIEKGETMAWKMIAARLEFVRQRSSNKSYRFEGPIRAEMTEGKDAYDRPSSYKVAAQATLETFTVLIEHYAAHQQNVRVQELLTTLKSSQIRPTTPFVNSLLELGTAIHNRPWVWSIYEKFSAPAGGGGVQATQYTFAVLWKNMKDHVDPVINRNRAGFPSPRILFSEMAKSTTWEKETLARDLYDQIVLCFGLSDDQVGTAVALRAMQRTFGVMPNEATVRSVVLQLAKVAVTNVKGYRTRRLNLNKDTQRRINEIGVVMKGLKEARVKQLEEDGVDVEGMSAEEQSEESLKLLISLLKYTVERRMMADQNLRAMAGVGGVDYLARNAAQEMGIDGRLPWAE